MVIGKGRLIAATSVAEFVSRSGGAVVRVRSPQLRELSVALTAAGLTVQEDDSGLTVSDTTTEAVGELAARNSIALHELSAQQVSLEQAYLASTDDATEYRGRSR